eukprot:gnl/MRDRNA2_/MRDRNA2_264066_c0_seq1.p1 gnl/MRDRNA2_/MRDRNA2_264066_c0~~gnl/MRDRNA2_/MRDRNA2_264066_c0_seq1.p1  ORF type:complete len:110 (-),score=7.43 gnl/MRDRNA2_/MRDRNA2_264066_c0_seq1:42-371(-)
MLVITEFFNGGPFLLQAPRSERLQLSSSTGLCLFVPPSKPAYRHPNVDVVVVVSSTGLCLFTSLLASLLYLFATKSLSGLSFRAYSLLRDRVLTAKANMTSAFCAQACT